VDLRPDGTGGLAVRDPESLSICAPSYLSQDGYEPTGAFYATCGAKRFDSGWTAPPSLAGLDAALDVAPEGRFERAAEMAAAAASCSRRNEVVTAPGQGTLVTFRSTATPPARRRSTRGCHRARPARLGLLRVSCGWWTTDEDLERLVGALLAPV
jgi:selenocysteine lyase/cysteine desulfurase